MVLIVAVTGARRLAPAVRISLPVAEPPPRGAAGGSVRRLALRVLLK